MFQHGDTGLPLAKAHSPPDPPSQIMTDTSGTPTFAKHIFVARAMLRLARALRTFYRA